jgi:hypothetical protein
MAYKVFMCESCPTRVALDEKVKERPVACPKCRGMLESQGKVEGFEGMKVDCPDCENSFLVDKQPFKCAFCDHTFSRNYKYF